jgi:hypothetical protein
MSQNIKVFIDHVGHTIVGEVISSDKSLEVKNPAVLVSAPNANGQLTVQLVPVFFKEFIKGSKREDGVIFSYPIDKVIRSEAELDERLTEQYINMFQPTQKSENKETPVIKLFDDEEESEDKK